MPFAAFDVLECRDDDGFWTQGQYADGIVVITMDFQNGERSDPPRDFVDDPEWRPLY